MPRILAIDWDRHEIRAVQISSGPTGTSVTGAWSAPLTTADPAGLTGKQIGTRLASAMSGNLPGKATTIVGVGRDNVQIKLLSLPPAPIDELPDLVRFQAEREFTALGSDAALDFIPLAGDSQTPNQVLALALSQAGMEEAREVCQAIDVEPDRIPVRGCAAAALVNRAGIIGAEQVALIANPLTDEADLVVQADDKVILLRTVRLPEPTQPEARQRALAGEIRRTIAAVRQQLTDRQVNQIVVCGDAAASESQAALADELELPVAILDPMSNAPAGLASKGLSSDSLSRFAAVLGMALGEVDRRPPIVDFANVRRRAERARFGRVHALATAAAVMAGLWYAAHLWRQFSDPVRELADLQTRTRQLQAQADKYKDVTAQAAAVERWLATDVNWLDELKQFAGRVRPKPLKADDFPVANDAVLTQLTLMRPLGTNPSGGRLDFKGVAKSSAAVAELEHRLGDAGHVVTPGTGQQDKTVPGYDWSFGLEVHVPPSESDNSKLAKP
jgi:Tfp pilus assembly PilM family ATPase